MSSAAQPVGNLLREWRQRRRLSQLDLALGAEVSARHVSFIGTGRSVPSRQMVMQPPVNVLRMSLHPEGVASRIVNLAEWRAHLLARLGHQVDVTADPVLVDLLNELRGYPWPEGAERATPAAEPAHSGVVVPHHDRLRDARRGHAVGAGAGDLLPGRMRRRPLACAPPRAEPWRPWRGLMPPSISGLMTREQRNEISRPDLPAPPPRRVARPRQRLGCRERPPDREPGRQGDRHHQLRRGLVSRLRGRRPSAGGRCWWRPSRGSRER